MPNLITFLMACLLPLHLAAASFHALLIRDTQAERSMQMIEKMDIAKMVENLSLIAEDAGLALNLASWTSKELSTDKVWQWLAESDIEEDDCLLIYFTGQAFCPNREISEWPAINFEKKKEGLEFGQIEEAIDFIKPRLAILLYDCTNYDLKNDLLATAADLPGESDSDEVHSIENPDFASLFLHAKGRVFLAAAAPGKVKYWTENGSIFTEIFLDSLRYEASESNPSWEKVLSTFNNKYSISKQTPLYKLALTD